MTEQSVPRADPYRVAVGICTYHREQVVVDLIERIADLICREGPSDTAIVVVDDSPDATAEVPIRAVAARLRVRVDYIAVRAQNIAIARNAAIAATAAIGHYVVCIDDDCVPSEGWLRELVRVADTHQAEMVIGHHEYVPGPDAPRWIRADTFLMDHAVYPDESVTEGSSTASFLIRSDWLRSSGVAFRNAFGRSGGEDMVFFADARAAGATVRFAAKSVVREPYTGGRTTFRYQLWRQVWMGNNEAAINRRTQQWTSRRLVLRGLRRAASGAVLPARQLFRREPVDVRWSIAIVGKGLGLVLGVLGIELNHR